MQNKETITKKSDARKELEANVKAVHKNLTREWMSEQDIVILLRYAHPDERSRLAVKLVESGELSNAKAGEFVKYYR